MLLAQYFGLGLEFGYQLSLNRFDVVMVWPRGVLGSRPLERRQFIRSPDHERN
jgi:hypothetical protein